MDGNPSSESVAVMSLELTKLLGEKKHLKDQISLLLDRCESLKGYNISLTEELKQKTCM